MFLPSDSFGNKYMFVSAAGEKSAIYFNENQILKKQRNYFQHLLLIPGLLTNNPLYISMYDLFPSFHVELENAPRNRAHKPPHFEKEVG